jgi:hypothetical protein
MNINLIKSTKTVVLLVAFMTLGIILFGENRAYAADTATLTVTKQVNNIFGGTAEEADFPLFVNGAPVTSGTAVAYEPGTYTISETQLPGYVFSGVGQIPDIKPLRCIADFETSTVSITLVAGDEITCIIGNTDTPKPASSTLRIYKLTNNESVADFVINVNGVDYTITSWSEMGIVISDLPTGTQTVIEPPTAGWGPIQYACGIEDSEVDTPTVELENGFSLDTVAGTDYACVILNTALEIIPDPTPTPTPVPSPTPVVTVPQVLGDSTATPVVSAATSKPVATLANTGYPAIYASLFGLAMLVFVSRAIIRE